MATNVVDFHRLTKRADPRHLAEVVTIRDRGNICDAAIRLANEVQACGLRILAWHDLATFAPMTDANGQPLNQSAFGWGTAELSRWESHERALNSPVLRACRLESDAFWISRETIRTRWPNRLLNEIDLDEFEQRTGFAAAIGIPVHLPFGQIGAAVLFPTDPTEADLEIVFHRLDDGLTAAVQRFVRGYVSVTRDERYLPKESPLSPREIECLNWVAHGKTDHEIGIILGCSHAGVRYHLTRACAKLGAGNRAQSVFMASALGHLGPSVS